MQIEIADAYKGLFQPHRFRIFYSGRGAGKSWAIADYLIIRAVTGKEIILCCREYQVSIRDSVKRLIESRIHAHKLESLFHITDRAISCKRTGSEFIFAGLKTNIESIKSYAGITLAWVEEAETLSQVSLDTLIPTVREPGSQIIMSFNPKSRDAAVWKTFVLNEPPPDSLVVKSSYKDNPWLPKELLVEAEHCKKVDYQRYQWIWGGELCTITEGSFYSKEMMAVHNEGRFHNWDLKDCNDLDGVCTWFDLGYNDFTSIVFGKFVDGEIHIIDFLENSFEDIDYYINELNKKPYTYAKHYLPHDSKNKSIATRKSVADRFKEKGMPYEVIPRTKSVRDDIEAVKHVLPICHFHNPTTQRLVDHLMSYRRKQDATTKIFTDHAVHDESSHASDAFRYMAVTHPLNARDRRMVRTKIGGV